MVLCDTPLVLSWEPPYVSGGQHRQLKVSLSVMPSHCRKIAAAAWAPLSSSPEWNCFSVVLYNSSIKKKRKLWNHVRRAKGRTGVSCLQRLRRPTTCLQRLRRPTKLTHLFCLHARHHLGWSAGWIANFLTDGEKISTTETIFKSKLNSQNSKSSGEWDAQAQGDTRRDWTEATAFIILKSILWSRWVLDFVGSAARRQEQRRVVIIVVVVAVVFIIIGTISVPPRCVWDTRAEVLFPDVYDYITETPPRRQIHNSNKWRHCIHSTQLALQTVAHYEQKTTYSKNTIMSRLGATKNIAITIMAGDSPRRRSPGILANSMNQ
jgi:hypothetical protein